MYATILKKPIIHASKSTCNHKNCYQHTFRSITYLQRAQNTEIPQTSLSCSQVLPELLPMSPPTASPISVQGRELRIQGDQETCKRIQGRKEEEKGKKKKMGRKRWRGRESSVRGERMRDLSGEREKWVYTVKQIWARLGSGSGVGLGFEFRPTSLSGLTQVGLGPMAGPLPNLLQLGFS